MGPVAASLKLKTLNDNPYDNGTLPVGELILPYCDFYSKGRWNINTRQDVIAETLTVIDYQLVK